MRSMKVLWQDVLNHKDYVVINSEIPLEDEGVASKKQNKIRFYFKFNNNQLYLTPREMQVIILFIDEIKIQKISRLTRLSTRTIEYYLGHIRQKFKCNRTLQVVNLMKTNHKLWQQYLDNKEIYFIKIGHLHVLNN